jgi:hypothetical protein
MEAGSVHHTFTAALDRLVDDVRKDRSILAVILCGSLSHDTVWARSDIDLVLVTIDDRKVEASDAALYADGVNVHAQLMPRTRFRQLVEGSLANSIEHSFLAKGRLLYTHDPSITDLCARLREIGARDTELQLLGAATGLLACVYKARKWLVTRGDLNYCALWILYSATSLAQIEVIRSGGLADREVIPQATALNPVLFKTVYLDLLNSKKTHANVIAALEAVESYVAERTDTLFAPVMAYLQDAGEARSASDIENHFTRHFNVSGVTTVCEYLADRGLIGKASLPAHLTRKSNAEVQELAFFTLSR